MKNEDLARAAHSVGQNCFHMIWTPKYRYPIFRFDTIRRQCELVLQEIALKHDLKIHELCVERDHIHLFVEIPVTTSVSCAFQLLKGGSSHLLRQRNQWMRKYKALWSIGKFYRSVGAVTDEAIQRYISDSHHVTRIPQSQTKLA